MSGTMEELWQMIQLMPEWSISKQTYQPMDGDFQEDQLDYFDDVLNTAMDPAMQIASGSFDPSLLAPTYEEEVIDEGSDEGRRQLEAVARQFPNSAKGLVAEQLLQGIDVDTALKNLGIQPQQKTDKDGKPIYDKDNAPVYDTAEFDRLRSWADGMESKFISDRERVANQIEIDHPIVAWAKENNLPDPREVYSAQYVNPALPAFNQQNSAMQGAYRDALKFDAPTPERQVQGMPQDDYVAKMANRLGYEFGPDDLMLQRMGSFQTSPAMKAFVEQNALGKDPVAGLGTRLSAGTVRAGVDRPEPMGYSSSRNPGRSKGGPEKRQAVQQSRTQQIAGMGWDDKVKRQNTINSAGQAAGQARNDAITQAARAIAASNYLQAQGRTPIGDAMLERIRSTVGR